ncbi:hypothetical protein ACOCG7_33865 (plasmid) [Paraburkholderia sp. DD10]|uniref:hypothetical protein n=1 Tax=Paraburkholderia sp. DD10 TaxID=3409691 RepID=UPI003BA2A601
MEQHEGPRKKPRVLVLEVQDRQKPDGPVIAQLLIERQESFKYYADGPLEEAGFELSYRMVGADVFPGNGRGEFRAGFSTFDNRVSVTQHGVWGHGFVTLDLPGLEGQRIGTYLMNEIVCWARQWPDADVNNIELLAAQARDRNTARRNRFYERFGFVFDYADSRHRAGMSRPLKVRDLKPVESWKENITEHLMFDFLARQQQFELRARAEAATLSRSVRELALEQRRAEAHPVWWAVKEVYEQRSSWIVAGVLLATVAVALHFSR